MSLGPVLQWYSICSAHRDYDPTCLLCQRGAFLDEVEAQASRDLFKRDPEEWRRQANAKDWPE